MLRFSVHDSGIGIAPDKIGGLFKPFSQADSSTTREFGGTGLGLSIVRQLALAMGGDVGVDSEAGQGATFWFHIRTQAVIDGQDSRGVPRAAPPASAQEADATRLKGHLLVAEDNPINAMVIKAFLGKLGITMTLVGDGQQAVDAIIQGKSGGPCDLVLMDLHMPVMDGYSATEKIRQWEGQNARPSLPIIALTADAFEEDRQHCKAVGMDDFLTKPIALEALKAAMLQWLPQAVAEKSA
jgi:CheY-like chemotaxis protein